MTGLLALASLHALFLFLSWHPPSVAISRGETLARIPAPVLAGRYLAWAERELPECYLRLEGPQARLTRAIIAVEAASRGPLESLLEVPMYRLASAALRRPPDWSVGPAQLRYATFNSLGEAEYPGLADNCANMAGALTVVRSLYRESVGPASSRRTAVIRSYNGQLSTSFSNEVYVAIVLAVYEALASAGEVSEP